MYGANVCRFDSSSFLGQSSFLFRLKEQQQDKDKDNDGAREDFSRNGEIEMIVQVQRHGQKEQDTQQTGDCTTSTTGCGSVGRFTGHFC